MSFQNSDFYKRNLKFPLLCLAHGSSSLGEARNKKKVERDQRTFLGEGFLRKDSHVCI